MTHIIALHWRKIGGAYILDDHDYNQLRALGKPPVDCLRSMMAISANSAAMPFLPEYGAVSA